MLYDILKDTRAFRELAKEGRMAGLEEGRREGRQEGLGLGLETLRLAVLEMIEMRFADSALEELARIQIAQIHDLETLRHLVVKVAMLTSSEEVSQLLAQTALPAQGSASGSGGRKKQAID